MEFQGKAGVPFKSDFKIAKILYEKLENSIEMQTKVFLFDKIERSRTGEYFRNQVFDELMNGFIARVIRTSNACEFFQNFLKSIVFNIIFLYQYY